MPINGWLPYLYPHISTTTMPTLFSTKFLLLLQTLAPSELTSLAQYLHSPYHNTNKNLPRLLTRLLPYYPDFSDPKLTKEKLFCQVLPKGKFSDRRMNNLMSEAYLAAEQFLVFQRFTREQGLQQQLLAEEFQARSLDEWFFRHSDREIKRLEAKEGKEWSEYLDLLRLQRRLYQHPSQQQHLQIRHTTIVKMGEQIDLLYLLEKAAIINEMIIRNRLYKAEQHNVSQELKKWLISSEGVQHPALDLYRMRFAYTEKEMLPQYQHLYAAFLERFDALNAQEQKIQLLSLLNDAKRLIKSGSLDITESLPLYQLGLNSGAVLNQGRLSANTYMSIVTASNTKGSFEFTADFVTNYTKCIPEGEREDCVVWAKAHSAYYQKDMKTCVEVLLGYDFQVPNFQLISRVLTTQAYFDLYLEDTSYQPYLFSFFDSFEKWLSREKFWSKSNHLGFLRFVQKCRTLARYHADADPKPEKMEQLFSDETNLQALLWLKQKREEVLHLKKKRLSRS